MGAMRNKSLEVLSDPSVFKVGEAVPLAWRNPHTGFASCIQGAFNEVRRGEPRAWRQAVPGSDILGYQSKSLNANSSTMKGPRGLAG